MHSRRRFVAMSLVVLSVSLGGARAARAGDEAALAQAVRDAAFGDEKIKAAKALAAKKTPAARAELAKLLADEDRFTREAALHGLVALDDRAADEAALGNVEENYISCDELVAAVTERKSFPIELLSKRYPTATAFQARVSYVKIACAVKTKEAEKFLLSVVQAKDAAEDQEARKLAFTGLLAGSTENARPAALEAVKGTDELADLAMGYLAAKGTPADLPVALEALDRKEATEPLLVAAYQAVAKWVEPAAQREKFLAALRSSSEERARAAIAAFRLSVPEATPLLCKLARHGEAQRTRVAAAARLAHEPAAPAGKLDPVIPALVSTLKETFAAREETPLIANLLTLGLASTFDSIAHGWNKSAFEATLGEIETALTERASSKPASPTYEGWLEWALVHGYTVDGKNVIQLVFAPDKAARRRGQEGAARLLGFEDRADFVKKTAGLADEDGAVSLALAQKLVAKGFLVDED